MAVNVKIEQKGLIKKELNLIELAKLNNLSYGISDDDYRLIPDKIGEHTLLYNSKSLARGIEVWFNNYDMFLSLSLPTSLDEIKIFYKLIISICQKLSINKFYREEKLVNLEDISSFIEYDQEASINALKDVKSKLQEEGYERFEILGIMNPISIGLKEINEIDNSLVKLGDFLNKLQSLDVFYAVPRVYKKNTNDTLFALYFIGENIQTVVPTKPYIFMNRIENISNWYVYFSQDNYIKYDDFIANVKKIGNYDDNHIIVNLTKSDIENFITNFKTKL